MMEEISFLEGWGVERNYLGVWTGSVGERERERVIDWVGEDWSGGRLQGMCQQENLQWKRIWWKAAWLWRSSIAITITSLCVAFDTHAHLTRCDVLLWQDQKTKEVGVFCIQCIIIHEQQTKQESEWNQNCSISETLKLHILHSVDQIWRK